MANIQLRLSRPTDTYITWGVIALVVFVIAVFNGFVAAILPNFAARLLVISAIPLVLLIALMSRRDKPLSQNFLGAWLVLLVLILACWPSYMFFKFGGLPSVDGRKLASGFSLMALLYLTVNRRQLLNPVFSDEGRTLRVGLWLLTTFVLWRVASCFVSEYPLASMILVLWDIANYYVLFILGALIFRGTVLRERFIMSFMMVASGIFLFVVSEWAIGKNLLLELAPRNVDFAEFNAMLNLARVRDGVFRAQGTFEHPLVLAEFAAMVASFGFSAVLWKGSGARKLAGWLSLSLAPVAGWMSGSRVAFISMGAGLLVVGLFWLAHARKPQSFETRAVRKLFVVLSMIIAVVVAIPTMMLVAKGKSFSESTSSQARLVMLDRGLPSIQENPIFGTGPGSSGSVAGIKGGSGILTLDNHLLAIAIESGVLSLLLFLALLIYPIWRAFTRLTEGAGAEGAFLAAGAGALVAFGIARAVLAIPYNQSFAFLIAGMMLAASAIALPKSAAKQ